MRKVMTTLSVLLLTASIALAQVESDKGGAWDGGTVVINDSVEFKGSWMKVGCDTNQGPVCWTDCLTRHDTLWTIRKAGAHYRISASKKNPSAKTYAEDFAGVNLAEGDSRIYLNMTDVEILHIQHIKDT